MKSILKLIKTTKSYLLLALYSFLHRNSNKNKYKAQQAQKINLGEIAADDTEARAEAKEKCKELFGETETA